MDWLDMPRKIREVKSTLAQLRAVAQLGRAPGSGPGGRGFKSHQPDLCKAAVLIRAAENVAVLVSSAEIG
jgi:hypothetical protein